MCSNYVSYTRRQYSFKTHWVEFNPKKEKCPIDFFDTKMLREKLRHIYLLLNDFFPLSNGWKSSPKLSRTILFCEISILSLVCQKNSFVYYDITIMLTIINWKGYKVLFWIINMPEIIWYIFSMIIWRLLTCFLWQKLHLRYFFLSKQFGKKQTYCLKIVQYILKLLWWKLL